MNTDKLKLHESVKFERDEALESLQTEIKKQKKLSGQMRDKEKKYEKSRIEDLDYIK